MNLKHDSKNAWLNERVIKYMLDQVNGLLFECLIKWILDEWILDKMND